MKKILLAASLFLILTASTSVSAQRNSTPDNSGQPRVSVPAKDSEIYKLIYAAVKKKHPKISKAPEVMRVQGIWARFAYVLEEVPEEEEGLHTTTNPNLILKKTGDEWQIVWTFDSKENVDNHVTGVPRAIKKLRGN